MPSFKFLLKNDIHNYTFGIFQSSEPFAKIALQAKFDDFWVGSVSGNRHILLDISDLREIRIRSQKSGFGLQSEFCKKLRQHYFLSKLMQTSLLVLPNNPQHHPQDFALASQKGPGRQSRWQKWSFSCFLHNFTEKVGQCAFKVSSTLNLLFSDPNATAPSLKKLTRNVLPWIEYSRNLPDHYIKLKVVLESAFSLITALQITADVDYFANGKYKQNSHLTVAGRIARSIAHLGEGMMWLGHLGLINLVSTAVKIQDLRIFSCAPRFLACFPRLRDSRFLQDLAQSLGSIRVFNFIAKIRLISAIEAAWALFYACSSLESLYKLIQPENHKRQRYVGIELAKNSAEFTLACLLVGGVVNIPCIGAMGCLCIGLEISRLIYKEQHDSNR